jgi:hypothetical protein
MLEMMIELTTYDIVLEQKRELRDKQSVIGRIYQYQNQKSVAPSEVKKRESKVKWGKKSKKKKNKARLEDGSDNVKSDGESSDMYSSTDEDSDQENTKPCSAMSPVNVILHSRQEMKPILEEEEEQEGLDMEEKRGKQKTVLFMQQESAINKYFAEVSPAEMEVVAEKGVAEPREPFLPEISSKPTVVEHQDVNAVNENDRDVISLPPI